MSRARGAWWLTAVAACVLGAQAPAHAQAVPSPVPLEVDGDDGCVTQANVRAAMTRYAGRRKLDATLRVRVAVREGAMAFSVLAGDDELAVREFERVPRACAPRVRALAIALVLALESAHAEREAAVASEASAGTQSPSVAASTSGAAAEGAPLAGEKPTVEAAPKTELQPAVSPEPAPEAPRADAAQVAKQANDEDELAGEESVAPSEPWSLRRERGLALQAGAGVLVGVLPEPALVLRAGVDFALSRTLSLELGVLGSPGTRSGLGVGEVDTQLFGGRAGLCAGVPIGALRASACAGAIGAAVLATGRGYVEQSSDVALAWLAGSGGIALEIPLVGPLGLRASADVLAAFVRPRLRVLTEGESTDDTASVIEGFGSLQLLWAFR